jgi:hypothetical protein
MHSTKNEKIKGIHRERQQRDLISLPDMTQTAQKKSGYTQTDNKELS